MTETAKFIKTITSRRVGCKPGEGQDFTVIGVAARATPCESDKGPYLKFGGSFEAVGPGGRFRSNQLILPGVVEDAVATALTVAQQRDNASMIEFGFRFYTEEVDHSISPIGYMWQAEQLLDPYGTDPLAELRTLLPAPEKSKK